MQIFRGSNKNPMVLYARERLPPSCPSNLLAGLFFVDKKLPKDHTTKKPQSKWSVTNSFFKIKICHILPNSFVFGECVSICHGSVY
jgi:hypothetical protein